MKSKYIWDLFIPIAISILLMNIQTFIDSVMIANYDIYAVSAVNIATQITSIFGPMFFGIITGANIFIVQYYASNRYSEVKKVLGIAVTFILPILFLCIFCLTFFSNQIIGFFVDPSSYVGELSLAYMEVYKFVIILMPFDMLFTYQFRAMKMPKIPMRIGIIQTVVNVVFNILLIYGVGFFPELGIVGAAYATLISKIVSIGLSFGFALYIKAPFMASPISYLQFDKELYKNVKSAIIPLILVELGFGLGRVLTTKIMVYTGIDQFTVYTVARQMSFLFNFLVIATANVSGIITGSALGKGENITKSQNDIWKFFMIMSCAIMIIHIFILPWLMPLFGIQQELFKITYLVLIANGIFMALRVYSSSFIAILKSGGDNNFIIYIDIGVTFLFMIPSLFIAAVVFNFNVVQLSYLLCLEMVFKSLLGYYRYKKEYWIKQL